MTTAPERAQFHAMTEGTQEDWTAIAIATMKHGAGVADRILAHLRLLDGDFGGFSVDRLTHSLQTATLAQRDGRPDDYVFCALVHDIGDTLGPYNHADVAAAIVKPFVSEDLHWMVEHHAEFQGYYFFHFLGLDPDRRERYRDDPRFALTDDFTRLYDQAAFDPEGPTEPLEHFEPLIREITKMPIRSMYTGTA